jgi:hypothetical protein
MVAIMDQSARRLPDLALAAPNLSASNPEPSNDDRRRRVRQKLHTPVYASFNGPQTGLVVDLSELIDLHEEGFAVQTSERLEAHRALTLCLDLPETRSFIHGTGEVIWSDDSGRGGVRFAPLSEGSSKALKEWLFANLLIGCSHHAARTEQLARREEEYRDLGYNEPPNSAAVEFAEGSNASNPAPSRLDNSASQSTRLPRPSPVVSISDHTDRAAPVEALRGEIRVIQGDIDAVLQLITQRALTLTAATGAALACVTGDIMICRARAGEPAPPLGAPVDISHGLSGECVRTGLLVSCEDAENDPRLDPEVGRALGIASLMAVPIVSDFRVVGLIEIFSPHPHSFTKAHGRILEHLVETIPSSLIVSSSTQAQDTAPVTPEAPQDISPPVVSEPNLTELYSLDELRSALRNPDAETGDPFRPAVFVADFATLIQTEEVERLIESSPDPVPDPDPEPAIHSRLLYRALIGLAIAAVVTVVGYLMGPLIEKHWLASSPSHESSLIQAAEAAWHPVAANRSLHPASLPQLRRLADQGDPDAQWQMGVRYHNGEDVPQDDAQAMSWFERAADQGQIDAQSHLGAYYWAGRGVPEDLYKAYFWSAIATAQGDEISKARLEGLASQMTRQQVAAARQEAETWIHTHSQRARPEAN